MSLDYIRRHYGVPAFRGGEISYRGDMGWIKGSHNSHLSVGIDGYSRTFYIHPTDVDLVYAAPDKGTI